MRIIERLNMDYTKGAITIAFIGDSVTHGCFESDVTMHTQFDFDAVYHNQLKKMLNMLFPSIPINIINAGIGGECARNAIGRLDRDVISKKPDLTVVCFGLNDINGPIEEYINSLDEIFRLLADSNCETIFMTPNMLNTYVSDSIITEQLKEYAEKTAQYQNEGRMDSYISAAIECAQKHNTPIADCYSKWKAMYNSSVNTTELLANFINHPNREMHKLFAYEILTTMFK